MRVEGLAGEELGTFEVTEIDAAGGARLAAAAGVAGSAATYLGEYRFDTVTLRGGGGLESADTVRGTAFDLGDGATLSTGVVATDVVVRSRAVVSPAAGEALAMQLAGTLTVEAGAAIDVGGLGYAGGQRPTQSADRRRILLAGASGVVTGGASYEGVYKFDHVTVHGGATLELRDTLEATVLDVDGDSAVVLPGGGP